MRSQALVNKLLETDDTGEAEVRRYLAALNPKWVIVSPHVAGAPAGVETLYFAGGNFSPKLERAVRFDTAEQAQAYLDELGRGVWAGHLNGVEITPLKESV